MQPIVSKFVHYVQYDGNRCCAAVITDVEASGGVVLHVFPPADLNAAPYQQDEVAYDEQKIHGTWHWPEPD